MAKQELKNIFLSASIPLKERDEKYFDSADIIAIRDAVIALTTVVLPKHRLIWGGHPSITPIIYHIMQRLDLNIQKHVTLYQSLFFEKHFPEDNNKFENIIFTENKFEKDASLLLMRKTHLLQEYLLEEWKELKMNSSFFVNYNHRHLFCQLQAQVQQQKLFMIIIYLLNLQIND